MSQLSTLLSEASATADDTSQDEQDFIQAHNKNVFEIKTRVIRRQNQLDQWF